MNYVEREIEGFRPDVVLVGAAESRREIYDYTGRLMRVLGSPAVVLPTHWDGGLGMASNRWLKWILVEIVVTLKQAPGPVGAYVDSQRSEVRPVQRMGAMA